MTVGLVSNVDPRSLCEWESPTPGRSLFVDCLTSQQHASVSQGWIGSDNCECCHTEIKGAYQTFYLIQSQAY